ncbi:hypothetical protein RJ492_001207 [Pluralibacter gergoviae]|uniref:Dit-like phage tail protein N-terminal domain-containing protein n=1 Tax=Pluralibacter gergoviae TaxID=61647 RepID=A0AAI9DL96_PLUGE|nr:hypothetical protein [Pluralibacter gergoviae]EKV9907710.1 hypothetical protein [Pluralibacter gergoviae]EKW7276821.1 hypothetical protein [Pluralibacter gergoviae]ELD4293958.1 hypothetical protein [Pluralibacter gergoviae]ELD4304737.1 hypothetical protein [Pluralibacter gergoviae]
MAITGIFTKTRPQIGGLYFDAWIEESTELNTTVSAYTLENATAAHDNAVTQPLKLTMTVAVSDNWFKALLGQQSGMNSMLAEIGAGITVGAAASILSGGAAGLAGIAASIGTSIYAGASRSQSLLDEIRELQRNHTLFNVVSSKGGEYKNCIITATRQQSKRENEGGLELVVEMMQLNILNTNNSRTNNNLPAGDTAATQGQTTESFGEVVAQ